MKRVGEKQILDRGESMKLLLDTHVFLWLNSHPQKLSATLPNFGANFPVNRDEQPVPVCPSGSD